MPTTIGWDAVALFLRHLPLDSETARAINPALRWTVAEHRLADIIDILSTVFGDGKTLPRPGETPRFADAQPADINEELSRFNIREVENG